MYQRNLPDDRGAEGLLNDYGHNSSFCFSSPSRTIICTGARTDVVLPDSTDMDAATEILLGLSRSTASQPLLVGAVPFEKNLAPCLFIPKDVKVGPAKSDDNGRQMAASEPARRRVFYECFGGDAESRSHFISAVVSALNKIDGRELAKVVLSRTVDLKSAEPNDLCRIVRNFLLKRPGPYCSAVRLNTALAEDAAATDPRILFGASPELLVKKQGREIVSNPLAGSAKRTSDSVRDAERAASLFASPKDNWEHKIVVEEIADALSPLCVSLNVPKSPSLMSTPTMWHLSSRISGVLKNAGTSSLALASTIHPTAALCGSPRDAALRTIRRSESRCRGFFGGYVGWCDSKGDGEWAVSIRCADASPHSVVLCAGAGIVAGSDPESEWQETEAKLATMLGAFGLSVQQLRQQARPNHAGS